MSAGGTARRTNPAKVLRASRHPDRPGQDCEAEPGTWMPVVDRTACEGKRDCVEVCPYDVFEVRRIDDADFAPLSFLGKLKLRVLCVVACPEGAITLQPVT